MGARARLIASQLAFAGLLVVAWQWASMTGWADPSFVGAPSDVVGRLVEWLDDGTLFLHAGSTLSVLLAGFVAGTLAGVALGILVGRSAVAREVLEPFLIFFNGMPRLILQPFFVVWLGFGFAPKVALVIAVIIVVVAVNVATALQHLDRDLVANVRVLGAGVGAMTRHVYLPSLSVVLLATSRANIGFAFQAALVSEFVGTSSGLGFLIVKGQNNFDVDTIWAALVVVVVLSTLLDLAIRQVEVRATRWMAKRG
jgi:NitT/TauT family transport system permease protein